MIRIHEIDYQINKEQNMQARTKNYESWIDYINYCRDHYKVIEEVFLDDYIYIFPFKLPSNDGVYMHKGYIMLPEMEE